jgi:hypothetical protein
MTIIKQSPLHSINYPLTQVPTNAPQQLPVQFQSELPAFKTLPPPDITTDVGLQAIMSPPPIPSPPPVSDTFDVLLLFT